MGATSEAGALEDRSWSEGADEGAVWGGWDDVLSGLRQSIISSL